MSSIKKIVEKSVKKSVKNKQEPERFPYQMMDISLIDLTGLNPRGESFMDEEFEGLKQSMKENGFFVHEPLLVRPAGDRFQLVAGHRRLQAAKDLNFELVPVMVRDVSDQDLKLLIFLDNLHRKDFSPLEEAAGIKQVLDGGITQMLLAAKIGKSQAYVANRLRLLDAPQDVRELVISQEITPAHVQILLSFSKYPVFEDIMEAVQDRVHDRNLGKLTVRELESDIIGDLVSGDDSVLDLDSISCDVRACKDHFDFSGCESCKDVVLLVDFVGSGSEEIRHKYCMNQSCWSVRLENAKLKFAEVEKKRNVEPNDVCFGEKERLWQCEANKKAREEDKNVWILLEEKLSGTKELGEKEIRFLALNLGEHVIRSAAVKKALKPWMHLAKRSKEFPAIKDIPYEDLPRLLLRFVIIQKMHGGNGLADMNSFNKAVEGLGI